MRAFLAPALTDTGPEREAASPSRSPRSHRTHPATSARRPTTPGRFYCPRTRTFPSRMRDSVLHCIKLWHKRTGRPTRSRAATFHFASAPISTSASRPERNAWAQRTDHAWPHALSTRVSGWMHIQALSLGRVPVVDARDFQGVLMFGKSSACSGMSRRAVKRRSRRRPN